MGPDDKTRLLPDVSDTRVGTHLSGIYELDEHIAYGGMGEVYRGHNIETGDPVAIKIVLPEFARDQTILSLFKKEALILNHLSHEAIVRYHVFTMDPGIRRPYLAMEFVDGKSLFDVMRQGPMPTEDVRKLCHRIASGLSAAHEAGTVHRDLSPDNIILPEGKVECAKLIDFGIARSGKIGGETLIGGRFAGKYNYVSPEQLGLYGGEVGKQSDIYSLGLVLAAVLLGKPLDMSGSQFEVVEKRRSVPDLSGIDDDFRPMIEAMLQPDPRHRPASMADIARATRDDANTGVEGTLRLGAPTARPQTEYPWFPPSHSSFPPKANGEPRFVPHRPPAHLSRTRAPPAPVLRAVAAKRSTTRSMTIAAVTAVAAISGAGAYLGGFLSPWTEPPASEGERSQLSPDLSRPSAPEKALPTRQTPENVAQSLPRANVPVAPPANEPDVSGQMDEPIQRADEIADTLAAAVDAARTSDATKQPPADAGELAPPSPKPSSDRKISTSKITKSGDKIVLPPASVEDTEADDGSKESARASGAIVAPSADEPSPPLLKPPVAGSALNSEVRQRTGKAAVPLAPAENTLPSSADEPNTGDSKNDATSTAGKTARSPPLAEVLSRSDTAGRRSEKINQQASDAQDETAVAMNIPKPQLPATDAIDEAADRISWLRDYNGGDCFYATATSVSERAVEIEGFGATVDPFAQMLAAFQEKFHVEPNVSVRLIDPAQCEVTHLLRALGATAAEKPGLVLDRTSVPNGFPVSGTLETLGGLRSSLLLIDHKGMVFNLDGKVTVQGGKGIFNFPIGLGPTDQAEGRPVPQIIIAITGATDIQAASFSGPTPAAVAFPKILGEIREKRGEYAATAKYFQLGG